MSHPPRLIDAQTYDCLLAHLETTPVLAQIAARRHREIITSPRPSREPTSATITRALKDARAEHDRARLRATVLSIATAAVAWIEEIDRQTRAPREPVAAP